MLTALLGAVWSESAPPPVMPHEAKAAVASASVGPLTLITPEERECLDTLLDTLAAPTSELWLPRTPLVQHLRIAERGTVAPRTLELGPAQARAPPAA